MPYETLKFPVPTASFPVSRAKFPVLKITGKWRSNYWDSSLNKTQGTLKLGRIKEIP
jgi:hypothetical protein